MTSAVTDETYLKPAAFVDSDAPAIRAFATGVVDGVSGEKARAIALYFAVRDRITYDPYIDYSNPGVFRASAVLGAGRGFCVGKAALLAACARAVGIAARPGYADVRNHMTSARLRALTNDELFYWHSYAELKIDGCWVKSTPAFDAALCARAKLAPLDFDGVTDSLFQEYDPAGRRHMEYVRDRGTFADVPFESIVADFRRYYPRMFEQQTIAGDFKAEVEH